MSLSFATPVARALNVGQTQGMHQFDAKALQGLEAVGVNLKYAQNVGYGFLDHLYIKFGHYYIDQGANQMIIDGKIKFAPSPDGVKEFKEKSVVLSTGEEIEADVVVFATGFQRSKHRPPSRSGIDRYGARREDNVLAVMPSSVCGWVRCVIELQLLTTYRLGQCNKHNG
jgi:hypothetical protein